MGHSFGGLVVLKTLTDAKGEDRFAEIYRSTIGLVFFGTPFRGTHRDFGGGEDSLSWLLKEAERANASMYSPNYDIFRPGDYSLLNVVDTFNKHTSGDQRPRIMCFTELQPTDIGRWVRVKGQPAQTRCILLVDEHSGALDETADRGKHARNRHHTNVHTFSRANDTDFEVLRIFLTETMEAGPGIIKERGRSESPYSPIASNVPETTGVENSRVENSGVKDSGVKDSGVEDLGVEDLGVEDSGGESEKHPQFWTMRAS